MGSKTTPISFVIVEKVRHTRIKKKKNANGTLSVTRLRVIVAYVRNRLEHGYTNVNEYKIIFTNFRSARRLSFSRHRDPSRYVREGELTKTIIPVKPVVQWIRRPSHVGLTRVRTYGYPADANRVVLPHPGRIGIIYLKLTASMIEYGC